MHNTYEALLLKAVTAPEPYPSPGRPIRNIASRCLVTIYSRGETRGLFDTIRTLLGVVSDLKAHDADFKKVCVFVSEYNGPILTCPAFQRCILLHWGAHGCGWFPSYVAGDGDREYLD